MVDSPHRLCHSYSAMDDQIHSHNLYFAIT